MDLQKIVTGSDTFLRLFHVLVTDEIMPVLTKSMENEEIGDKETFGRQLDIWSKVAEIHNSVEFVPTSLYLPTLHNDFKVVRPLLVPRDKAKMQDLFEIFTKTKTQLLSLREFVMRKEKKADMVPPIVTLMKKAETSENYAIIRSFPAAVLYLWHLEDAFQWLPSKLKKASIRSEYLEKSGIKGKGDDVDPVDEIEFLARSLRIENAQEALIRLQDAELHHSNMVKDFADMISKINTVGGKQQDLLIKVVDDVVERVDASFKRCTAIENSILIRQRKEQ